MVDINLRKYYLQLLNLDSFRARKMSSFRIAELTAIQAYVEANYNKFYKKVLISRELKKPFCEKLYQMFGRGLVTCKSSYIFFRKFYTSYNGGEQK